VIKNYINRESAMVKTYYYKKIISISIVLLVVLLPKISYSQHKNDFVVSFGFGLISKGGISLKYYVADGVGFEICSGLVPHIFNLEMYCNVYPKLNDNRFYFVTGYSFFGGGHGHYFNQEQIFSENPDTLLLRGRSMSGITLGFGYEAKRQKTNDQGDFYYSSYFGALGPTYVLKSKTAYFNYSGETSNIPDTNKPKWMFFVEGGYRRYF
jgi:hypothetical protein